MQKKAYLLIFVGLALIVAISLIALTTSGILFPHRAESRVAIVFNGAIGENNFVEAIEGAQRILNTIVNVADFDEIKSKVIGSGFAVTENVFNGTAKENILTWKKYVNIRPVDEAFVLKITTEGRNQEEAEELAAVIAHEVSLEVSKLFTNLRGISDQPKPINQQSKIIFVCFFVITIIVICFFVFWVFFNKKKSLSLGKALNKKTVSPIEKLNGDPRYFLQKFLEEHQKH